MKPSDLQPQEVEAPQWIEKEETPLEHERATCCGIKAKRGIGRAQIVYCFLLPFFMLLNAETNLSQVQSLLQNPKYFHLTKKETSQVVSRASEIGNFFNIALILVAGYLYDIFGRKALMFVVIVCSASLTAAIPWTSPSESGFLGCWISW